MSDGNFDFALAIGGEAGQGIATPGDTLARIVVRRGLHLSTYGCSVPAQRRSTTATPSLRATTRTECSSVPCP